MINRLFVYGSLGPGQSNEYYLTNLGGVWEPATIKGHLHEAGWGADIGFPGVVLDEKAGEISGHIFSSEKLADSWGVLDEFEGEEYKRVVATVSVSGMNCKAYVYVINEEAL